MTRRIGPSARWRATVHGPEAWSDIVYGTDELDAAEQAVAIYDQRSQELALTGEPVRVTVVGEHADDDTALVLVVTGRIVAEYAAVRQILEPPRGSPPACDIHEDWGMHLWVR